VKLLDGILTTGGKGQDNSPQTSDNAQESASEGHFPRLKDVRTFRLGEDTIISGVFA